MSNLLSVKSQFKVPFYGPPGPAGPTGPVGTGSVNTVVIGAEPYINIGNVTINSNSTIQIMEQGPITLGSNQSFLLNANMAFFSSNLNYRMTIGRSPSTIGALSESPIHTLNIASGSCNLLNLANSGETTFLSESIGLIGGTSRGVSLNGQFLDMPTYSGNYYYDIFLTNMGPTETININSQLSLSPMYFPNTPIFYISIALSGPANIFLHDNPFVTAVVTNFYGVPYNGLTLTLTGSDASTYSNNGVYVNNETTFIVGNTIASVMYSITYQSFISNTFTITPINSIVLSGASYASDLSGSITATLRDVSDALRSGVALTLSGSDSSTYSGVDNLNGTYTYSVAAGAIGVINYTITANSVVSNTFALMYVGAPYSIDLSGSTPIFADQDPQLLATVLDLIGQPIPGLTVSLTIADIVGNPTGIDNGDGTYSFPFIFPEEHAYGHFAAYIDDPVTGVHSSELTITYFSVPTSIVLTGNNSVSVSGNNTITATVTNVNSDPIPGLTTTLIGDDLNEYPGTDNTDGTYTFTVTSSTIGNVIYTLTIDAVPSDPFTVAYLGPVHAIDLTEDISGAPHSSISINAGNYVSVKATVTDIVGHPLSGVTIGSLIGDDETSYNTGYDNSDGTYSFTLITSSTPGNVIYTLTIGSVASNEFTVTYL